MKTKWLNRILVLFLQFFFCNKVNVQRGINAKNLAQDSNAMLDVISMQTLLPNVIVGNSTA